MPATEFPIAPAQGGAGVILAVVFFVVLTVTLGIGGYAVVGSVRAGRTARFEVSAAGLRISGVPFYSRLVPAQALRIEEARLVDLRSERGLAPRRRTNGIGLPGFSGGWFRLGNGEKALVFVTTPLAVYVPTRGDYSLVLTPRDPDGLLRELRRVAAEPSTL